MSEAAAYRRIRAARALQLFPHISALLRAGTLTLESIALLHPYLNDADAGALLTAAVGKRVSEVEKLVASRRTQEPRHDVVRMIAPQLAPQTRTQEEPPLFSAPPKIAPVAPAMAPPRFAPETAPHDGATLPSPPPALARSTAPPQSPSPRVEQSETHAVRIAFTADAEFHRLLQETQAAMRHKYPDGRLDGVFRDALRALLRKIRPWAYRKGVPVLEGRE